MKMPHDVLLTPSSRGPDAVHFETRSGLVSGVAYRKRGEHETHYDIAMASVLSSDVESSALSPSILQESDEVGSFEVLGRVDFFFDDGVFVVSAHGFDFWVEPDDVRAPVELGSWVRLAVRNLTLYV